MTTDALEPHTPDPHKLDLREIAARAAIASGATQVILFGSRARGDAREDSDVDLLLVLPDEADWMQAGLAAYRTVPANIPFDILTLPESVYARGETLFARIVALEGRVLYA